MTIWLYVLFIGFVFDIFRLKQINSYVVDFEPYIYNKHLPKLKTEEESQFCGKSNEDLFLVNIESCFLSITQSKSSVNINIDSNC